MTETPYSIVVFSFNRGEHLENCVTSIERHAPGASIRIFDDNSDLPATREVLERLATRHDVVLAEQSNPTGSKVGSLYPNMQRALDELPDNRLFSFFQDDMQMVRDLEPQDIATMAAFFDHDERNAFIGHAFLRGHRRDTLGPTFTHDAATQTYRRSPRPNGWGTHFAAIHTSRTDRLRGAGYRYARSEKTNDARSQECFASYGTLVNPFSACLPAVPVHRHKIDTWAQRKAAELGKVGLYPIVAMTPAEVAAMRARDPEARLPWSEDFLLTTPPAPEVPWTISGFQGRRWLKNLHRLEVGLRRALPSARQDS